MTVVASPAQAATVEVSTGDIDLPTQNGPYTSIPFYVSEGGGVSDIKVRLRMTHPAPEDLHVSLRTPSGRTFTLIDGLSAAAENLGAGPTDCTTTQWMEIDTTSDPVYSASPPYVGSYGAFSAVDLLNGEAVRASGEWRLNILDRGTLGGGDTGILHCAELELTTDTTNPTFAMEPYQPFILGDSHVVTWDANDENGIDHVRVQHFGKPFDMQNHMVLSEATEVSAAAMTLPNPPGWSQCLWMQAFDMTGNSSDPIETCFARPVDDTKLTATGFKRKYSSGAYMDTVSKSQKKGAALRLADAYFTDLALVVTKCPGCGSVKVIMEGVSLGTYSLDANNVKKQHLIPITPPDQGRIARTVDIVVKTSDKPILIEGLGVLDTYIT